MITIFLFAVACIFGSIFVRDIDSSNFFSTFLDYTVSFENRFYDFRMKSNLDPKFKSKEIVLVKIDDYSLQKLGVWPIPRTEHAKMINKLQKYGAKVVALDILFPEKSPQFKDVSPDEVLAESITNFQNNGGRIFLAYTLSADPQDELEEAPVEMLNDAILTRNVPESDLSPKKISRYNFPIEELVSIESGLGSISAAEDGDGIFRHYQLVANVDTIYYGSLALNSYEAYKDQKNTINIFADNTGELQIEGRKMEINRNGEVKIRYIGADEQFPSVSLYDLIAAPEDDAKMVEMFNGKIIFVGSTALGAHDLRPSPLDAKMPGVYSHMNMAHMLIHKYFYKNTNESVKYSLIFLIAGMLLFLMVQKLGNPFLDAAVVIAFVAAAFYADRVYFLPEGYELKLFYSFFCVVACYSWNTFLKFYEANKEKKQIKGTFARYVAPTIVDEMLKDPEKLHVGGTKMDITCLFSDVRDFTKISEGLSATELAHSLNMYMGAMTDIVFETKGTLDKYIGDAIVAIWGAPLEIGNHAQHAVEGAIKMMEVLPSINDEFKKLGRPVFNVGIGLNSGECSVGNMGSERIFSYTALGDNMNLGARLESLCKYYGAQIIISDMTLERLDLTNIKTRPIDKVVVKGKTTAVGIHEVLHPHHWMTKDPDSLAYYLAAYSMFQKRNFSAALDVFNQLLLANEEDKPTKRLRDICKKYVESPDLVTDEFEVTVMTEK
ncbi:MAG: CHASE2 domain-containing protein [Bacteriovoracia bacterium]